MNNNSNIINIFNILSSRLVNKSKYSDGIIKRENNEIILTHDNKLYENFKVLQIDFPYFPSMSVHNEELILNERKKLQLPNKFINEIKELFSIINLYINNNNEICNFLNEFDVFYFLEYNSTLYQLSFNMHEIRISKASKIEKENNDELKNVIRFNEVINFYNNVKNTKVRKKQKKA